MPSPVVSHAIVLETKDDKQYLMEQYKVLLSTLQKDNEVRGTINNFWVGINGALIGIIAYVRDSESMGRDQKPFFLLTILFFGFILTFSWLSSLLSIKRNIDTRNEILVELEKHFPAKIFTATMKNTGEKENWSPVVLKEMFVPLAFLAAYIFFGALLYFTPRIIVPS